MGIIITWNGQELKVPGYVTKYDLVSTTIYSGNKAVATEHKVVFRLVEDIVDDAPTDFVVGADGKTLIEIPAATRVVNEPGPYGLPASIADVPITVTNTPRDLPLAEEIKEPPIRITIKDRRISADVRGLCVSHGYQLPASLAYCVPYSSDLQHALSLVLYELEKYHGVKIETDVQLVLTEQQAHEFAISKEWRTYICGARDALTDGLGCIADNITRQDNPNRKWGLTSHIYGIPTVVEG